MQLLIFLVVLGILLVFTVILWVMGGLGPVINGIVHLLELLGIAWRNIRQRGVASFLTASSMALGIMLLVCVLSMVGVVSRQFDNNASLGYNLLIGAKGGSLQLTLNSVFYLSKPIENIPYEYYLECKTQAERKEFIEKNAIRSDVIRVQWEVAQLQNAQAAALGMPTAFQDVLRESALRPKDQRFDTDRDGRLGRYLTFAIPLALGDFVHEYRVVATTSQFFETLKFGPDNDKTYEFREGRNFHDFDKKNGFYEAVIGSTVARRHNISIGDTVFPRHGAVDGEVHQQPFTIVGILAPTGTPNDRGVFVNLEGFYLMADHAKPMEDTGIYGSEDKEEGPNNLPLPLEQREITAIIVSAPPAFAPGIHNLVNEETTAQAVYPVAEIYTLLDRIVGPIQKAFVAVTGVICLVSGIGILVSIYNSMNDRRKEIAIMRALGASRYTISSIILLEAVILALGGGFLGWIAGHGMNYFASGYVEDLTGVSIGFFDLAPPINLFDLFGMEASQLARKVTNISPEILLIPGIITLAVLVGLFPAVNAYQTDVAEALSD